jgi:hypothetical protein
MNRVGLLGVSLLGLCLVANPLAAGIGSSKTLPRVASRLPDADGFRELEAESTSEEWAPEPVLRYEQDGSQSPGPSGTGWEAAPKASAFEEADSWRRWPELALPRQEGASSFRRIVLRAFMEPMDFLLNLQNVRASCEKGFSDLSIHTSLPEWIDSLGCDLGVHSKMSINFDMLGFEDFERDSRFPLDARHATPRLGCLATSLGISLKF